MGSNEVLYALIHEGMYELLSIPVTSLDLKLLDGRNPVYCGFHCILLVGTGPGTEKAFWLRDFSGT